MARIAKPAKGMVLAAGLGSRLRPLTTQWPKPLIPFIGTSALELALWRFANAGIRDVAVNAHYLPDQIEAATRSAPFGLAIKFAIEPTILGTGGAYNPLRIWLNDADLVVLNGDVISTVDVPALLEHHRKSGAVATMALLPDVLPGESAVHFNDAGIVAIGKANVSGTKAGNFACAQILSPIFLDLLPKSGSFDIISKGYQLALEAGLKVSACVHLGFWHDLRSPAFFAGAVQEYLRLSPGEASLTGVPACRLEKGRRGISLASQESSQTPCNLAGPLMLDHGATIDPSASIGPAVMIESGVRIGKGAVVRNSVLLPGADVASGSRIENAVIIQGMTIQL